MAIKDRGIPGLGLTRFFVQIVNRTPASPSSKFHANEDSGCQTVFYQFSKGSGYPNVKSFYVCSHGSKDDSVLKLP
jgi:hypothetical protein